MSITWIGIISDNLMKFLNLMPLVTGLSKVILGMTILAWGNSIGDYFANSSLARLGYGVMAVTGCFAG